MVRPTQRDATNAMAITRTSEKCSDSMCHQDKGIQVPKMRYLFVTLYKHVGIISKWHIQQSMLPSGGVRGREEEVGAEEVLAESPSDRKCRHSAGFLSVFEAGCLSPMRVFEGL